MDVFWNGETFSGTYEDRFEENREFTGVRTLDVTATLDESQKQLVIYVINRSREEAMETTISLTTGRFMGIVRALVVNGPDIKAENTFDTPNAVGTSENTLTAKGQSLAYTFEPHSVTVLVCAIS